MERSEADRHLFDLLELTRGLLEPVTLERALDAVCRTALKLLPGEHASIRILDQTGTRLLCGARVGTGVSSTPMSCRIGEGVIGWVVQHGEPARVDDTTDDPRFKSAPEDQGFVIRSIQAVPLLWARRVVGVLGVTSSVTSAFSREHQVLAELLANCAAPPIERARLEHLTITDGLTMAYNQRYLFPRLEEEIERARRQGTELHVLSMDLDHFKQVNDRYGHAVGDRVLQGFADRVRSSVRLSDVFVRRGGEEFVLIMPDLPHGRAGVAAQRIQHEMSRVPLELEDGLELIQTVSIGAVTWDRQESAEELEGRADASMYEAKRLGRDRVVIAGTGTGDEGGDRES
jgi:diguanylate cyclase (GGDEF)-like protein